MAAVEFRISAQDIRRAVKSKVEGPIIALTKNPHILYNIADKALEIVTPYVPMKYGYLRDSADIIQNSRATKLRWGIYYASYQYDANDFMWKRFTPGTKSHWTEEIEPGTDGFEELTDYASDIMKKEL